MMIEEKISTLVLLEKLSVWKVITSISIVLFAGILGVSLVNGKLGAEISDSLDSIRSAAAPLAKSVPYLPKSVATFKPSYESIEELERFQTSEPSVVGIAVAKLDFPLNKFENVFVTSKDEKVNDHLASLSDHKFDIFSDDKEMNERIVLVLDGKLDCRNIDDTPRFKSSLGDSKQISKTCTVSIPSIRTESPQNFGGFLTILVDESLDLTSKEGERVKREMQRLADNLYKRDIK